jgi:hypothetical protein
MRLLANCKPLSFSVSGAVQGCHDWRPALKHYSESNGPLGRLLLRPSV